MPLKRFYVFYCATLCFLCLSALILMPFSGCALNVLNQPLWDFTYEFSRKLLALLLIPIHPILYILTIISSKKRKQSNFPNGICFLVTAAFHLALFIGYVWLVSL